MLCEGYEFDPESKRGESEFQIYAPTGHHAIELFPLGSDATVEFFAGRRVPTFPELENGMFPVKDKVDGEEIIPGLYQTREDGFVVPKELENVISSIIDCRYRNIMMIGGKGSGKSSANRYACNRLLKKFGKVIWLECDPGQPEFDVPGFMSLTEVYLPRVGPSYCTLGQEYYTTRGTRSILCYSNQKIFSTNISRGYFSRSKSKTIHAVRKLSPITAKAPLQKQRASSDLQRNGLDPCSRASVNAGYNPRLRC